MQLTRHVAGRLGPPAFFGHPDSMLAGNYAAPGQHLCEEIVERVLAWCHWMWFFVPHGTVVYVLLRHRERFGRSAARIYAVFDVGAVFYWAIPTAVAQQ